MSDHGPIFIVAGETSGDLLGAGLMRAIKRHHPEVRFIGIGGERMQQAGLELVASADALAVMGFVEIIKHLPALFKLRDRAKTTALEMGCRLFVGIDAPEFNLNLAKQLNRAGVRCIQYVSPQVWAWRPKRVYGMKRFLAHILCLLPFETDLYAKAGLPATFVGHPAADRLPLVADRDEARVNLGISPQATVLALLPGSRRQEVHQLLLAFINAAELLQQQFSDLTVVLPIANAHVRESIERIVAAAHTRLNLRVVEGKSAEALAASNVVLVASGTATLETLLSKRPMVVAYRTSAVTAWLLRTFRLMKAPFFAQPNLLAGRLVVEEWFQEQVTAERLAAGLTYWLTHPEAVAELEALFTQIHRSLKKDASEQAAVVVLDEWQKS